MSAIIETERLTKSYGRHRGVIELDLEVEQGEVFGFLGPNGAGKTTTIRLLLDLIRPPGRGAGHGVRPGHDARRREDPPAGRLPAGRVRPVRQAHRRPDARLLRQPLRRGRPRVPALARRAVRARSVAALPRVLEGQQAE